MPSLLWLVFATQCLPLPVTKSPLLFTCLPTCLPTCPPLNFLLSSTGMLLAVKGGDPCRVPAGVWALVTG